MLVHQRVFYINFRSVDIRLRMCEGKSQMLYVVSSPKKQFWYIPPLGVHIPPTASDELITSNRWTMKCGWTKQTWEMPMDWNRTSTLSLWAPKKKADTRSQQHFKATSQIYFDQKPHWQNRHVKNTQRKVQLQAHHGQQSTRYQQVWLASSLGLTIMVHYSVMISISG